MKLSVPSFCKADPHLFVLLEHFAHCPKGDVVEGREVISEHQPLNSPLNHDPESYKSPKSKWLVSNGTWFKKVLAEDELICCVLEENSGLWERCRVCR